MSERTLVAIALLTSINILALGIVSAQTAKAEKRVVLCHFPPGNPANAHTITVGEAAVSAHLGHGDQPGECPTGCRSDDALCDDGNACTSDSCAANGECTNTPVNCDDDNPCTIDRCDEARGCVSFAADDVSCDDGNACTSDDTCGGATCEGFPIENCCAASDDCNDHDPCTIATCLEGFCTSEPRDCAVADKCSAGFCDPTGECDTAPVRCDDSNFCTDDTCEPATGCTHTPTTTPPETTETSCADDLDNDCDGAVDAADPDCGSCGDGVVQEGEECDDGNTNPFDGCDGCILVDITPD